MDIEFKPGVSQETIDRLTEEVDGWPQGLKDDFQKNGINIVVGNTPQDTTDENVIRTGQGEYDTEGKTIYLWENSNVEDGSLFRYSPSAMTATLNHEAGHAMAFTVLDKFPEQSVYGNLLHKDIMSLAEKDPAAYADIDPHLKGATEMHNYPASVAHENFAEMFANVISSDKSDTRISADQTPRSHAIVDHIVENYKNDRPALDHIDDYAVTYRSEHAVTESGLRRPGRGTTIVGPELAALEERLKQQEAAKGTASATESSVSKSPAPAAAEHAQTAEIASDVSKAAEKPHALSISEEFGRRAGIVGGAAVGLYAGTRMLSEGASASEAALATAEAAVPLVSSAVALDEGRYAEATMRTIEEAPFGIVATEIARPIAQGLGANVDPSMGQMIIEKATSHAAVSPEQREFMRVYDALPSQATLGMPPEVASLAEYKGMIQQAETSLDRTRPSDILQRNAAEKTLESVQQGYSGQYDELIEHGGMESVNQWIQENAPAMEAPSAAATATIAQQSIEQNRKATAAMTM